MLTKVTGNWNYLPLTTMSFGVGVGGGGTRDVPKTGIVLGTSIVFIAPVQRGKKEK